MKTFTRSFFAFMFLVSQALCSANINGKREREEVNPLALPLRSRRISLEDVKYVDEVFMTLSNVTAMERAGMVCMDMDEDKYNDEEFSSAHVSRSHRIDSDTDEMSLVGLPVAFVNPYENSAYIIPTAFLTSLDFAFIQGLTNINEDNNNEMQIRDVDEDNEMQLRPPSPTGPMDEIFNSL